MTREYFSLSIGFLGYLSNRGLFKRKPNINEAVELFNDFCQSDWYPKSLRMYRVVIDENADKTQNAVDKPAE